MREARVHDRIGASFERGPPEDNGARHAPCTTMPHAPWPLPRTHPTLSARRCFVAPKLGIRMIWDIFQPPSDPV